MTPLPLGNVSPLVDGPGLAREPQAGRPGAASFSDALGQALGGLEKVQLDADHSAEEVALGGGNLHETSLALAKADTAMRLAVKVRNKIVDAYQEIMRMSV